MEPLEIVLVGCGVMGARHVRGYAELERVRPRSLRLRAVCDPRPDAAARVAAEAEELLGYRPRACRDAAEALAAESGIAAADVVTENTSHPAVAIPLLEAGLHVQIEKPLAVTAERAAPIAAAARRAGRILAVAENNRRDPMNRMLRHAARSGMAGPIRLVTQVSVGSGRRVAVTPWRHDRAQGGLALDVGIHQAYMLEYLMGEVESVYARAQRVRETREWTPPGEEPRQVPVESDDLFTAVLTFAGGAQGAWVMHFGSAGERQWQRTLHGEEGVLVGPADRSGAPVRLERGEQVLEGEALAAAMPEFRLNDVETRLFGERPGECRLESAVMDRRLIAAETADFVDAVREGRPPEVPGETGLRSVAVIQALAESAATGLPVRVAELIARSG